MIKKFLILGAVFCMVSCNNAETETTSSDSTSTTDAAVDNSTTTPPASSSLASFDESASYVSLKTKKPIKVKADASKGYVVDFETNEPLNYFFYNPATRDTFDWNGNVVNSYLILGNDGNYTLDEARWSTKVDGDGDAKAKDHQDTKIKTDDNGTEAKIKTDTSKTKISSSGTKTKKKD